VIVVASIVVAVLFAALWQGSLIGLATLPVLAIARRASAATRHTILWCAFLAIAFVPIVVALPGVLTTQAATSAHAPALTPKMASSFSSSPRSDMARRFTIALGAFPLVILIVWLLGVAFGLGSLVVSLARLAQIRSHALPLYRRDGIPVLGSDDIAVPIAVGFSRPVVVLPNHLVRELSPDDLVCAVLHEVAHIRRGDAWANLLQMTIGAFFFFNPALRAVGARIATEREIACDDRVVAQLPDRQRYARCLLNLADRISLAPTAALGALGEGKATRTRIRQLLDTRHNGGTHPSRPLVGGAIVTLATVALALQAFSPVIAFAPTAAPSAIPTSCNAPAKVLKGVPPEVPESALESMAHRPYTVTVRLDISASGLVTKASILTSSGRADLDKAALTAAFAGTYTAALVNCVPTAGSYLQEDDFTG